MREKILALSNDLTTRLLVGFRRFPAALALAFAAVIVLIYCNHNHLSDQTDALRLAQVLILGIPLALCVKMAAERGLKEPGILAAYLLSALGLLGYYTYLLPDLDMVSMSRYFALVIALCLLFVYLAVPRDKEDFELYVMKLLTNFIVSYFYAAILYLGLAAIIFTINTLFSAGISGETYLDIWLVVAGIFAPAYFLAGIPTGATVYEPDDFPRFLQILLLYIVMPLIGIYTGILYVYFIKILVTRHWPVGMISHLVLWYGLICTGVVFFIYLLREKNAWVRGFLSLLPKLILPLLIMMFVAMGIRIDAYGVTENRYLVLAGGLWVSGCMSYCAVIKRPQTRFMVLSAALAAVLAVSGPWSCYAVAKHSQNARFEDVLTRNKMLSAGKIIPAGDIALKDKITISSIVDYFDHSHQLSDLHYVPRYFDRDDMKKVFGFDYTVGMENYGFHHSLVYNVEFQEIGGYDYYLAQPATKYSDPNMEIGGLPDILHEKPKADYNDDSGQLRIIKGGQILYTNNIKEVALKIHEENPGTEPLNAQKMTFTDENQRIRIKILFQEIGGTRNAEKVEETIDWLNYTIFIKEKTGQAEH